VSLQATSGAVQGGTAIFNGDQPLKMEESGNHNFPIRQPQSPEMGFCDILTRAEGLLAVAGLVKPRLTWTVRPGLNF